MISLRSSGKDAKINVYARWPDRFSTTGPVRRSRMFSRLRHSIAFRGLTWFVTVLILDSTALICFFQLLNTSEAQAQRLENSRRVSLLTNGLADALVEVDSSFGKFVKTGDQKLVKQVWKKIRQFDQTLEELRIYYRNKPEELAIIDELRALKVKAIGLIQDINISQITGDEQARSHFGHGVDDIFKTLAQKLEVDVAKLVRSQYEEQQEQINNESKTRSEFKYVILICCLGNMIFSIVLSFVFTKNVSARLSVLVDNMVRFESNRPLRPPLLGDDEIVYLDSKFHEMSRTIGAARQRERMITDYASDLILSFDQAGKFIDLSEASTNFWGFQPADLIGSDVLERVAPENRKDFAECCRLAKTREAKKNFEGKLLNLEGKAFDSLWTFNWVDEEKSMFCVAHDISERKKTEALLAESELRVRTIIEKIPVGLAVLDKNAKVLLLNEKLLSMLSTTLEQLSGRPLTDFFSKESIAHINFAQPRLPNSLVEATIVRPRLADLPVEMAFGEISLQDQAVVLCTILDISERKKIEAAREQFLHMITHDMRTPLTSARGYFQLLETDAYAGRPEAYKAATDRAARNISEVINLISNLLDVNKLKADNFELAIKAVKISELFKGAVATVAEILAAKGIQITWHESDHIVNIDENLIGRVVVNLLSNACKFSPPGSNISISCKKLSTCLQISVKDQGRGVPAEEQERIFESYSQVSPRDFQQGAGTGLGLAICKRIIEAHGGSIGVESIAGQGSTFWFTLPS